MIGESINNYRIVSTLGTGGMGTVYLAEHPFMGRKAAMKVLRQEFAQDAGVVERFMNEARAANAIHHPNIIDIIDVGRLPSGIPYLMMEYLEGESLAYRLKRSPGIPVDEAVDIALQTADALAAAHAKGIVHRDLKPDNLFLTRDESAPRGERIKVLDFGIAKLRGDLSGSSAQTESGSLMGTPPYMSPEQCRGLPDGVDHRTDVYALGIILYEMLCGAPPFVSAGSGEIVMMHMTQAPRAPREARPEIPRELETAILMALAKDREERFASMADFQVALRAIGGASALELRQTPSAPLIRGTRIATAAESFGMTTPSFEPRDAELGGPGPGPVTSTTLGTASGQLAPGVTRRRLTAGGAAGVLAGLAIAASIGIGVALKGRGITPEATTKTSARTTATTATAATTTTTTTTTTAPASTPVSRPVAPPAPGSAPLAELHRPPAPPPPTQVVLKLRSSPTGARVVDEKNGEAWGVTPIERQIARSASVIDLHMEKQGFTTKRLSVPLDEDFEKVVFLERLPRSPAGKSSISPSPARIRNPQAATAAATPPPVGAPAAAPAKAEKW